MAEAGDLTFPPLLRTALYPTTTRGAYKDPFRVCEMAVATIGFEGSLVRSMCKDLQVS